MNPILMPTVPTSRLAFAPAAISRPPVPRAATFLTTSSPASTEVPSLCELASERISLPEPCFTIRWLPVRMMPSVTVERAGTVRSIGV